jgi:23S rRNA pseudouridine955/2504/2580 synthase
MTTSRTQAPKNHSSTAESSPSEDLSNRQHKERRKAKDDATQTDPGKTAPSRDAARTRTAHPPSRRAPSSYASESRRSEAFKPKKRNDRPATSADRTPHSAETRPTASPAEARLQSGLRDQERSEERSTPRSRTDSRSKPQLRSRAGTFLNRNQQNKGPQGSGTRTPQDERSRSDTRSKPASAYGEEDPEDVIFGSGETAVYWQYQPVDVTPAVEELSENGTPKPKAAFVPAQTTTPQVTWYTVDEDHDGQRLDNFLVARLKGVPKTRIYRLIRESQVRINKGRVKPDTRIKTGDLIRVAPIRMREIGAPPVIGQDLADSLRERIIYEDDGLIVLNKPAGLAVHGGSGVDFGIIEAIRQTLGKPYLELVHRLDRETSGLLMIAKKRSTLKLLQDYLRDGKIRKTYLAIVKGVVALDKQRVDVPLAKIELPSGERRVRVAEGKNETQAKESRTDFAVIERFAHATLVEASPLTGRTHQIRVHGLSINHPLLGDDKYGHERVYHGAEARRLCLHAVRLSVPGYQVFESPQPDDFVALIERLRKEVKGSK